MTNKEKYLLVKESTNILKFFKFAPTPKTPPKPSGAASRVIKGTQKVTGEKVQQEGNTNEAGKTKPNIIATPVTDGNATKQAPTVTPPVTTDTKPNLPPNL